ncbi:Rne/Rng family ribonuclease, partial [bacterium]|nr:Rne/Rng family ribonuclease [bacterium]
PEREELMRKEIVINVARNETRIAILEEDRLVELWVERPEKERMVGNIFKGLITSVLPGMQAAFVDIGLPKRAFLHVSDVTNSSVEFSSMLDMPDEEEFGKKSRGRGIPIQNLLQKGQEVLIQIVKESIGTKGPRVTSQISLPGRFLVLIPNEERVGISRKIETWSERKRLKKLAADLKPNGFGLIVRTIGKKKTEKEFHKDIQNLLKTWNLIKNRAKKTKAPALVHREMGITSSLIRDLFTEDIEHLVLDSKKEYEEIISYLKTVSPDLCSHVELYTDSSPIFDSYNIEPEIDKTIYGKVWMKKGGYIVIDHTEALVTIDVNTGRYVGKGDQAETVLKTNMLAANEIARQLRLRDIGGIIVIDFIDMEESKNRRRVFSELKKALKRDRSKTSVLEMSDFGLVEMTRQRVRPSLLHTFRDECPTCSGTGRVNSIMTVITKIERWLKRAKVDSTEKKLLFVVPPKVREFLLENREEQLAKLRRQYRFKIQVEGDCTLNMDKYMVFSLTSQRDITDQFKA